MKPAIVVIGSSNTDMVIKTEHIPVPGETILGGTFFMNAGGKGANQAVAVARLGGNTTLISKIGNDVFGKQSLQLFDKEGINTRHLFYDEDLPSGVALITIDEKGENSIVVAPGANGNLYPQHLEQALDEIANATIILMQLEIPMETVEFVAKYAASKNVPVMLDPGPASKLSKELLSHINIITPNQTEAEMLCGISVDNMESAKKAAEAIHNMGVKHVVITMGALGVVVCSEGKIHTVATPKVKALDTTAAGDVFNGGLAVALSEGKSLTDSVNFGCLAAAVSVTRLGAQSSIPYRSEIFPNIEFEKNNNES